MSAADRKRKAAAEPVDDAERVHCAIGIDAETTAVVLILTDTVLGRAITSVLPRERVDRLIAALSTARDRLGTGDVAGFSPDVMNYPSGPGRKPYPGPFGRLGR